MIKTTRKKKNGRGRNRGERREEERKGDLAQDINGKKEEG